MGVLIWVMKVVIVMSLYIGKSEGQEALKIGFYRTSCPSAEGIVRDTVNKAIAANPTKAAGIIRLFFHDCFVRGCDASLLLEATKNRPSEQEAEANLGTLRGLEIIDQAKARLEAACPNIVSCADILAFAARDSAKIAGGISYAIPSGRRDGRISNIANVDLPSPNSNVNTLITAFATKGLSLKDMVALSGAHSIGKGGCNIVASRLYSSNKIDPSLDPKYASFLKKKCPKNQISRSTNLDPVTPNRLDNQYYRNVKAHRGLFSSDEALLGNAFTARIVDRYANNSVTWAKDFASAMVRLGSLNVLTGTKGEIRRKCGVVN